MGATSAPPDVGAAPHVGDSCTWELRVAGSTSVTRLTWTTRAVQAHRVRVLVESITRDAQGGELARTSTDESTPRTTPPRADGEPVEVEVGGRRLGAWRTREEDRVVTRSREVPHGGIVRLAGPGGLEQVLVAYVRGP
jgi:hypothetical protein